MGKTLTYDEFVKKYINDVGGDEIKGILGESESVELEIMEEIYKGICDQFYLDYLSGTLDFIDEEDKPENNTN